MFMMVVVSVVKSGRCGNDGVGGGDGGGLSH